MTDVGHLDTIIWTHVLLVADGVWFMWLTGRTSRFFAIASPFSGSVTQLLLPMLKIPVAMGNNSLSARNPDPETNNYWSYLMSCYCFCATERSTQKISLSPLLQQILWLTSLLLFWRYSGGCLKNCPHWQFAWDHWLYIELYGVLSCLLTHRIELNWQWQRSRPLSESFCPESNLHLKGRPEEECV